MGTAVHKKVRPDGTTVYRLWSTVSDAYITGEVDRLEMEDVFLWRALRRVIAEERRDATTGSYLRFAENRTRSGWQREQKLDSEGLEPNEEYELECRLADAAHKAVKRELAKYQKEKAKEKEKESKPAKTG